MLETMYNKKTETLIWLIVSCIMYLSTGLQNLWDSYLKIEPYLKMVNMTPTAPDLPNITTSNLWNQI